MENVPATGGALLVSNHSGGLIAMDVPVLAVAFFDEFGSERPSTCWRTTCCSSAPVDR